LGKTSENLGKIPETLSKNGAQLLQKNTIKTFFGGHTNNRYSCSLWEKICGQKVQRKLFGQVWRNLGKNPSLPQKFACSYTCASS